MVTKVGTILVPTSTIFHDSATTYRRVKVSEFVELKGNKTHYGKVSYLIEIYLLHDTVLLKVYSFHYTNSMFRHIPKSYSKHPKLKISSYSEHFKL